MAATWINDLGRRIGQGHHRAKLTDTDVDQILALRDAGMSYGAIARKFDNVPGGVAKSTVRDICTGRIRGQACAGIKRESRPTAHRHAPEPIEPLPWTRETAIEPHELPPLTTEEPGQRAMRLVCFFVDLTTKEPHDRT